jgi:hypothetical protein
MEKCDVIPFLMSHYWAPGIRKAMALRNRTFTKDNSFTVGEL